MPEADIEVIHEFISDFLESFTREFPEQHIKPKAHFLIHYPDQIKLFGPLVNVWTLRFEGELNYFKEIYATTNRKKYAKRHQMLQCLLSTSKDLYDISAVTGRTKLVKLNLLPQEVALSLHTTSDNSEEIYIATSLKFRGVKYSVGLCVAVGMEGDLVQYGCI